MDDMKTIENKITEQGATPVPSLSKQGGAAIHESPSASAPVSIEETEANIVEKAYGLINSDKIADKYSRALAKNAEGRLKNKIERQTVENERLAANNTIDRKELENKLYTIRQESKRLKEQQNHLSKMQRSAQKAEKIHAYWEAHKDTLSQYKMHEGSSRIACSILLWLDGLKCFFIGLSKVSDALIKALKYIIIFGCIFGVVMFVPVTRNWFLSILGFVKK